MVGRATKAAHRYLAQHVEQRTSPAHKPMRVLSVAAVALLAAISAAAQVPGISQDQQPSSSFRIGRLKYSGGGDWYNDPSAEVNLLQYVRQNTNIPVEPRYEYVDIASDNIFLYPMLFLTGHGNVNFSPSEPADYEPTWKVAGFSTLMTTMASTAQSAAK